MARWIGLNEYKAITADDSRLWTPLECLEAMVRDIKSGEIFMPSQLVVHSLAFPDKDNPSRWHHNWDAAGVTIRDHLALLDIAKESTLGLLRG
jgi:hypothetical protein